MDGTTTARAVAALGRAQEALDEALRGLAAARTVDWVSDAADGYRHLLGDLELAVARLGLELAGTRGDVVRHVRAADLARAVQLAVGAADRTGGGASGLAVTARTAPATAAWR